jgi:hypothetical protein
MTPIDNLLVQAKAAIERGESAMHEAAEHIAEAQRQGATQRQIAERIGKSAAWVNALLAWRRAGFQGEVFARWKRPAFSQAKQKPKHTKQTATDRAEAEAQKAKAEAKKAKADAERAKADAQRAREEAARYYSEMGSPKQIRGNDRARLVKVLGMLGSDRDGEVLNAARHAEQLRRKLNASWDELIIGAVEEARAA